MEKIYFKSDPKRGGDLGNYWHYLLGYFLPVINYINTHKSEIQAKHLIFDSCNPLSDEILKEYLQSTDFTHSFEKLGPKSIDVPRKDWKSLKGKVNRKLLQLELLLRGSHASIFTYHQFRKCGKQLSVPRWDKYLDQYGKFLPETQELISKMVEELKTWADSTNSTHRSKILVLKRADPPAITQTEAGQEARWLPGYGTERRSLREPEKLVSQLLALGFDASLFTPGDHNLKSQIQAFSAANVVIAIRGAELINMLWMSPGSMIIMQESADFSNEAIQVKLAKAFHLQLHILPHRGEISPEADYSLVKKHISKTNKWNS
ncbi:glycosyltransferase 61 family protein [Algoriphagus namhaensis]|uniref:Glycosyltransferase 61 family protein n=1 Tax=Algoriphagus namhaensis TaxID=915353 RepID=A0ABV8AMQ7_9BACT